MHSQDYNYESEDIRYARDKSDIGGITFLYNSDLSGEVHIVKQHDSGEQEMFIPGWMLLEFVGNHINSELISKVEEWSGRETLGKLIGG